MLNSWLHNAGPYFWFSFDQNDPFLSNFEMYLLAFFTCFLPALKCSTQQKNFVAEEYYFELIM